MQKIFSLHPSNFFLVRSSPSSGRSEEAATAERPSSDGHLTQGPANSDRSPSTSPNRRILSATDGDEHEAAGAAAEEAISDGSAHDRSPRDSCSSSNGGLEDRGGGGSREEEEEQYEEGGGRNLHHHHRHRHHHHHHHHASLQLGLEAGPAGLVGLEGGPAGLGDAAMGPMSLPPPPQHITSM